MLIVFDTAFFGGGVEASMRIDCAVRGGCSSVAIMAHHDAMDVIACFR